MFKIFIFFLIKMFFFRCWIRDSYEYYDDIRKSYEASFAGITAISGYLFANSSPETVKVYF